MDRFKLFLLNEERSFLGHRVGDVLTAMQDVQQDIPNLGQRHLTKLGEDLVNQIRKILHSRWSAKNYKHLKELQKIGVAIKRAIDEKGDLRELLPAATQAMQDLSTKLGVKVNNLQAPINYRARTPYKATSSLPAVAHRTPSNSKEASLRWADHRWADHRWVFSHRWASVHRE